MLEAIVEEHAKKGPQIVAVISDQPAEVMKECYSCKGKHHFYFIGSTLQHAIYLPGAVGGPGFDFQCLCGYSARVYTNHLYPAWKCLACKARIPRDNISTFGGYELPEESTFFPPSRRQRSSTSQRTPRTSRPVPEGAISLAGLAERIKVEPKRLRAWLRKVGWRSGGEAGSAWYFSPEEANEIGSTFGGRGNK